MKKLSIASAIASAITLVVHIIFSFVTNPHDYVNFFSEETMFMCNGTIKMFPMLSLGLGSFAIIMGGMSEIDFFFPKFWKATKEKERFYLKLYLTVFKAFSSIMFVLSFMFFVIKFQKTPVVFNELEILLSVMFILSGFTRVLAEIIGLLKWCSGRWVYKQI